MRSDTQPPRKQPLIKFLVRDPVNNDEFQTVLYRPDSVRDYEQSGRRLSGWLNITRNMPEGRLQLPGLGVRGLVQVKEDDTPVLSLSGPVPVPREDEPRLYVTRPKCSGATPPRYFDWRGHEVANARLAGRELVYYSAEGHGDSGRVLRVPLGIAYPTGDAASRSDIACKLFEPPERLEIAKVQSAISSDGTPTTTMERYQDLWVSSGVVRYGHAERGLDIASGLAFLLSTGYAPSQRPRSPR